MSALDEDLKEELFDVIGSAEENLHSLSEQVPMLSEFTIFQVIKLQLAEAIKLITQEEDH